MARSEEFDRDQLDAKRVASSDVTSSDERTGDVLGLSGAPVPKSPGDPSAQDDPESVAKRRARLHSGEDEGVSTNTTEQTSGATSIDMGSGGSGTDVSGH